MTRINTNVSSLTAQNSLARSNAAMQQAMARLSTGLRINSGKDDPAGLIASEVLRSDIVSAEKAISNSQRANQMIATADSALGQVTSLLNDIRGLVTEAANDATMGDDQIAANQLQVDSALEALNRVAQTTNFQGQRLLDGSLDFLITGGTNYGYITDLEIGQANFGSSSSISVAIDVTTAATKANIDTGITKTTGTLSDDAVFELRGTKGTEVFNFASGTSVEDVKTAINLVSDSTGVTADDGSTNLELNSVDYGADASVEIVMISGTGLTSSRATGTDYDASINGVTAHAKGDTLSINTAMLDLSVTLDSSSVSDGDSIDFTIDGGGALFQLGPDVVTNQQARIGIPSVNSATLSGASGRLYEIGSGEQYDLSSDTTTAAQIVDEVLNKITSLRGRLGAFQRTTLETNIASLRDTLENLVAAESEIRDADFAAETAALTRAQILTQAGTSVLAIANSNPQNVLALLQ